MNFRQIMLAAAATAFVASQVHAGEVSPFRPASRRVRQTQGSPNALVALGVGAVVAGGLAVALASDDSGGSCGAACNPPTGAHDRHHALIRRFRL